MHMHIDLIYLVLLSFDWGYSCRAFAPR
jgi:hypothetical protein